MNNAYSIAAPDALNVAFMEDEESTVLANIGQAINFLNSRNDQEPEINMSTFEAEPEVLSVIESTANNSPGGHFINDEILDAIEPVANNGPVGHFLNNSIRHARKQRGGRKTYRKKHSAKRKSRKTHKRLSYRRR